MSSTRGGPVETWAMARANRARKAETPTQPSPGLRLRAPQFYPTHLAAGSDDNLQRPVGIGATEADRSLLVWRMSP